MKVLSYNTRGLGEAAKRRRLRSFLLTGNFDLCLFQETKKVSITLDFVRKLRGISEVEFSFKGSNGLSGGLLCIWKRDSFPVLSHFEGEGFLGFSLSFNGKLIYVVNIYSSCLIADKRKLWEDLSALKSSMVCGEWCIGGGLQCSLY